MDSLAQLQQEIFMNKVRRGFNTTDVGKEIILMVEELGELAKAFKNSDKKPAKEISNREDISDAVGDLMVYCLGLCEMLGISGEDLLKKIIEENKGRTHTGRI